MTESAGSFGRQRGRSAAGRVVCMPSVVDTLVRRGTTRSSGPAPTAVRRAPSLDLRWLPLAYAALLVITRLLASQSLEHDEAEQVLFSQRLEWGYSLQPPLYTWITWLSIQVFGLNLFALAAVKAALLLAMFTVLAGLLRRLDVPSHAAAGASMILLFSPFFAWNMSLNITHTVLSATIFAVTILHAVRLIERPTACRYTLLGVWVALGILAKYNFAVFAAALFLAGLTLRAARRVLADARMGLAVASGLLVLAPHLGWLFQHWDGVFAALVKKTGLADDVSGLRRVGGGLWTLLEHALVLTVPLLVAMGLCLGRNAAGVWRRNTDRPMLRLLERTALALGIVMALVVLAGVNRMTVGWLAPGLLLAPLIVFGRLAASGWPATLTPRLVWALGLVMLVTATIKISVYGAWHGRNLGRDLLFAEAARFIERQGLAGHPFRADSLVTAGNLRFHCPILQVASLDMPLFQVPGADAVEVFVWNDSKELFRSVRNHLAARGVADPSTSSEVTHVSLPRADLHPSFRRVGVLQP
jgi:4-amino-4-deoxy-L-arabinose transferase-like glycosyltransferase